MKDLSVYSDIAMNGVSRGNGDASLKSRFINGGEGGTPRLQQHHQNQWCSDEQVRLISFKCIKYRPRQNSIFYLQILKIWKATALATALLWVAYYWNRRSHHGGYHGRFRQQGKCRHGEEIEDNDQKFVFDCTLLWALICIRILNFRLLTCSASPPKQSPTSNSTAKFHLVTPFSSAPGTAAQVARLAQSLAHVGPDLRWTLMEVAPSQGARCLRTSEAVRRTVADLHLEYSHLALSARTPSRCWTEERMFELGVRTMANAPWEFEKNSMVHFGRLEAVYPTALFGQVLSSSNSEVVAFPSVLLLDTESTQVFSPIVDEEKGGGVVGFSGNLSSPFRLLSMAFRADYLEASEVLESLPELDKISALEGDGATVFHLKAREKSDR